MLSNELTAEIKKNLLNKDLRDNLSLLREEKTKWKKDTHAPEKIRLLFKLKEEELGLIKASKKYGKIRYYPEDVFEYIQNRKIKNQGELKI